MVAGLLVKAATVTIFTTNALTTLICSFTITKYELIIIIDVSRVWRTLLYLCFFK